MPHHYDVISNYTKYTKGKPMELDQHHWFYGSITEEQATAELSLGSGNNFLVRHTSDNLILSSKRGGWRYDTVIHHFPEGYWLEGKDHRFKSISEVIVHYQKYPIDEKDQQVLGMARDRRSSGIYLALTSGPELNTKDRKNKPLR